MKTQGQVLRPRSVIYVLLMLVVTGTESEMWAQGGTIGGGNSVVADFSILPPGMNIPIVFQIAGITFLANPPSVPRMMDSGNPRERGYGFKEQGVTVVLPIEVSSVEVRMCLFAGDVEIEALSSNGTSVVRRPVQNMNRCEDVHLSGERITVIRFTGGRNEASIVRLSANK